MSLDRTVRAHLEAKYDTALDGRIREWLGQFLGCPQKYSSTKSLHELLKDGVDLCAIVNKCLPGAGNNLQFKANVSQQT